jgi:thiamine pyrophosphate-dependent acetolactate synthase large subunit-like protein
LLVAAAEVLNKAGRVTILAGAGCAGAHDQLIGLAQVLKAPVVHAFWGKEFVEYDNPYDVGHGRRRYTMHLGRPLPADERGAPAHRQAIGALASQPRRQVIALSGDGGIAMLLGELLTLRQQQLPVKVVVFNNSALSFVELEMKAAGIVTYGTDLVDPDFAGIARSAGLFGARVEAADELEAALREALEYEGPVLVDVRTARHELSLPPKLTYGEIKCFTLYATRTVLSGQADELIELAKTNLRELEME